MIEYIKEIAILIILSQIIMHLIPKKSYNKYVKLFLGTIMVMAILKPIDNFLNLSGQLDKYVTQIELFREKSEIEANLNLSDEYIRIEAAKAYESIIKDEVEMIVAENGMKYKTCTIEFEKGSENTIEAVKSINLVVSPNEENDINEALGNDENILGNIIGNININDVLIEISGESNKENYSDERENIKKEISDKYNIEGENVIINYDNS